MFLRLITYQIANLEMLGGLESVISVVVKLGSMVKHSVKQFKPYLNCD